MQIVLTCICKYTCFSEETKLDKLPPVPPSSLFTSSLRRRAQQNQMMLQSQTQNRLLNNNDSKFHSEFSIFNRQNSQFSPNSLSSNNNNNNSNEASQLSESERQMATATRESNSNHANDRVEVTLFKDHKYKDFGFYVADSPNGLIVKKVRENGPADNNEHIRPNCKILKVRIFVFVFFLNPMIVLAVDWVFSQIRPS